MAFRGRALAVKKLRGVELKGVIVFEGLFFSDRRCEKGKAFYSNHQVLGCADRDEQMSNKVGAWAPTRVDSVDHDFDYLFIDRWMDWIDR